MSKPDDLPVWSTDANYPAGSHSWNGSPTKIEPIAGKQAEGFEPKDRPPAQYLNWLFNLIYQWLAWLDGLWDADGNLTLDADASVSVSGEGNYYHGTRTLMLNPQSGLSFDGSAVTPLNGGISGIAAPLDWVVPIQLPVGKRITEIRTRVKDNATGPTRVRLQLNRSSDGNFEAFEAGPVQTAGAAGTKQDLNLTGFTTTITAGKAYELHFDYPSGADFTQIYQIEVDFDQLPP